MAEQQHSIQQQVMQLDFFDKDGVQDFYAKVSALCNNQLSDISEGVFNRLVPEDLVIKLDKLHIDLGTIAYDYFEQSFAEKYEAALEKELAVQLDLLQQDPGSNILPVATQLKENYIAFMRHFLRTGTRPWWATGERFKDVASVLAILLEKEPALLSQLLQEVGTYYEARFRLAYQFSNDTTKALVTLLEPAEAPFIIRYHADVQLIQQKEQVIKSEGSAFERALWLFILAYLLVEKGSYFNRKMFVKSTLAQLAAQFNSSYEQVLFLFSEALVNTKDSLHEHDNLVMLIRELSTEHIYLGKEAINAKNKISTIHAFDILAYYFMVGALPLDSNIHSEAELAALFIRLKQTEPADAVSLLQLIITGKTATNRLLQLFDSGVLNEIVILLQPAHADFIINYAIALKQIKKLRALLTISDTELRQLSWQLIIQSLVVKGRAFEPKDLVSTILRNIATQYAVDFKTLLVIFIQGLAEQPALQENNRQLFSDLVVFLQEQQAGSLPIDLLPVTTPTKHKQADHLLIKDLLLYWLNYSSLPWWAQQEEQRPLPQLFEALYRADRSSALLVLKFAFGEALRRQLFLSVIPQNFLLQLLANFNDGKQSLEWLNVMAQLIDGSGLSYDLNTTKQLLVTSLLQVYSAADFRRFEKPAFLNTSITQLALLWRMETGALTSMFLKSVEQNKASYSNEIADLLKEISSNTATQLPEEILYHQETKHLPEALLRIKKKHTTSNELLQEAARLVEYFLLNYTFSSDVTEHSALQQDELLRELIILLAAERSSVLRRLLAQNNSPMPARMHLHSLFATTDGYDALAAKALLSEFYKSDVAAYLKEEGLPFHHTFASDALAILNYFLTWQKLPDEVAVHSALQGDAFLRTLIILATRENTSALRDLLSKTSHNVAARMHLHDLFITYHEPGAEPAKTLLLEFFRTDVTYYLRDKNIVLNETAALNELLDTILTQVATKGAGQVQQLLTSSALIHLVAHHYKGDKFHTLLRVFITEKESAFIKGLAYVLDLAGSDKAERELLASLLREFSLKFFIEYSPPLNQSVFIRSLMAFLQAKGRVKPATLYTALVKAKQSLLQFTSNQELFVIFTELSASAKPYADKETATLQLQQQMAQSAEAVLKTIREAAKEITNNPTQAQEQTLPDIQTKPFEESTEINEKIYVKNAGLVILHPFLHTFFHRVNLMYDGKFIRIEDQQRAAHLLQYLVWETQEHAEEDLALNKILSGLWINTPLPPAITMTEQELAVSKELINVVIMQWDKLKNTSAEGFRTSFLQREGSLFETEESYTLRVEQRGYDMLLQTLPWGLGMIKTSWMHKPLFIEWT